MDEWIRSAARELAETCGNLAITHDAPGEGYFAAVIASHYSAAQWKAVEVSSAVSAVSAGFAPPEMTALGGPTLAEMIAESRRQTKILQSIERRHDERG